MLKCRAIREAAFRPARKNGATTCFWFEVVMERVPRTRVMVVDGEGRFFPESYLLWQLLRSLMFVQLRLVRAHCAASNSQAATLCVRGKQLCGSK